MTINLMLMTNDREALTKTPTSYAEYSGTLRAECSVIDPVFVAQIDQSAVNITALNYAYIPEFRRYYYITGMRVLRENLWEISLHCDVLMSYAGYIRALPALVARDQSSSRMLYDDAVDVYADSIVSTVQFPNALPAPTYILAMIGRPEATA